MAARALLTSLILPAMLAACAASGPAGDDDLAVAADPGPAEVDDGTDGPGPADWTLPPCYRACDRVTACGIAACAGYDWPNAGNLFEACFGACDDPWAATVLDASGCPEVLAGPLATRPDLLTMCDTNPCVAGCRQFAACLASDCPAVDPLWLPGIERDCHGWCTPESAAWVLDTPCTLLVDALCQNDPAFAATCRGAPPATCPDEPACAAWSGKLTGCIAEHCAGNADPYREGLEHLLRTICGTAPDCPSVSAVQAALAPATTCSSAGFDTMGHDPPFQAMCEGTLGVTTEQVRLACEHLFPCPGAEWLGSVEGCMGFVAVVEGAGQRVLCLDAAGDCTEAYACLEGL